MSEPGCAVLPLPLPPSTQADILEHREEQVRVAEGRSGVLQQELERLQATIGALTDELGQLKVRSSKCSRLAAGGGTLPHPSFQTPTHPCRLLPGGELEVNQSRALRLQNTALMQTSTTKHTCACCLFTRSCTPACCTWSHHMYCRR
jgi:hypothetical protein